MNYDFSKSKEKAAEIKEWFKGEISSLRTGRASPALVENILVDSYGAKTPLKHLASISIEDAKTIRVTPWDTSVLKNIEAAISLSQIGIQPIADKQSVRLTMPELTDERRKSLVKILSEKLEDARVALRRERDESWKDIQNKEREGVISEDDKFRLKDDLQKIIDKANEELDAITERKELEIKS